MYEMSLVLSFTSHRSYLGIGAIPRDLLARHLKGAETDVIEALARRWGAEPSQGAQPASRRDPQHQRGGVVYEASVSEALARRRGAQLASQGVGAVAAGPELPLSPVAREARQRADVEWQKRVAAQSDGKSRR
jgi:hypothetical protein